MLGLILWFGLSAGLQEGAILTQGHTYELPPISIAIDVHASSDWLDIYGIYKCDMSNDGTLVGGFWPWRDTYTVGAVATFGAISLRAEHMCAHPVDPYGLNRDLRYDQWHNRIEVRITSKGATK